MSRPRPEDLMTLADVARALPRDASGNRVSTTTVWRWTQNGRRGRKLRYLEMGRRYLTCWDWVLEFLGIDQEASDTPRNEVAARRRATEQALDRWGV